MRVFECPGCHKIQRERMARAVMHRCPNVRGNPMTLFKEIQESEK